MEDLCANGRAPEIFKFPKERGLQSPTRNHIPPQSNSVSVGPPVIPSLHDQGADIGKIDHGAELLASDARPRGINSAPEKKRNFIEEGIEIKMDAGDALSMQNEKVQQEDMKEKKNLFN